MSESPHFYAYELQPPKRDTLFWSIISEGCKIRKRDKQQRALFVQVLLDITNYEKNREVNLPSSRLSRGDLTPSAKVMREQPSTATSLASSPSSRENVALEPGLYTCAICLDTIPAKNPNTISCVSCQFCTPCLAQYLQAQIEDKTINLTSRRTIRCPCFIGDCELTSVDVERVLRSSSSALPAERRCVLLEKFCQFSLDLEVQDDATRVFCPAPGCGGIVSLANCSSLALFPRYQATCPQCTLSFCALCSSSHSQWVTCDMAAESQFNKWRRSNRQGVKKCPHCSVYIEKNEGCSHMTCQNCSHRFCWLCLRAVHGDSSYCKVLSVLQSPRWGSTEGRRVAIKCAALPVAVVVGGVAVGAAGAAAGLAVAAGGLSSPVLVGYACYRRRKKALVARRLAEQWRHPYHSNERLCRGIIISIPRRYAQTYPPIITSLIQNMPTVSTPSDQQNGQSSSNLSYQVAYTGNYVLYFTSTPREVPGFQERDFPFALAAHDHSSDSAAGDEMTNEEDDIRQVVTEQRAYMLLSAGFIERTRSDGGAESAGVFLSSMDDLFRSAVVSER